MLRIVSCSLVLALGGALVPAAVDAAPRKAVTKRTAKKAKKPAKKRVARKVSGRAHLPAFALPALPVAPRPAVAPTAVAPTLAGVLNDPIAALVPAAPKADDPASEPFTALGVLERETPSYVTLLSRPSVPAGKVLVQLQNTGEDPHNLRIARADGTGAAYAIADVAPGATASRTVTLTPGAWRLFCSLRAPVSHEAAGMHAALDVVG